MTCDVSGRLGGYIKQIGKDAAELCQDDWDKIFLVCGKNRTGKTVFSVLFGYYMDNTLSVDRVCYSAEQFLDATKKDYPPGTVFVWDESHEVSEHWSSSVISGLKEYFKTYAYKNYIVILVTPTFFDMNKYWCVHRSDFLFEVYANPKRNSDTHKIESNRGQVRLFNENAKRVLYFNGVKTWDMKAAGRVPYDRFSKFPDDFPIKESDLRAKKAQSLVEKKENGGDSTIKLATGRQRFIVRLENWLNTNFNYQAKNNDLAYIFNVNNRTIQRDKRVIDMKVAENGLFAKEDGDMGDKKNTTLGEVDLKEGVGVE